MRSSWTTALISKTAPIIHMCLKKVFPNHLIACPLWNVALIKACLQDSQFFANSIPSCTFVPILSMSCDYRHAGLSLPLPPEPCPPSLFYPSRCDIEHGQSASVFDSWCCLWVNFLLCADLLECQKVHIFFNLQYSYNCSAAFKFKSSTIFFTLVVEWSMSHICMLPWETWMFSRWLLWYVCWCCAIGS